VRAILHEHLGRTPYARAYEAQVRAHARVLEARSAPPDSPDSSEPRPAAVILTVEHDPVITISRRAGASGHLLASNDTLARMGVDVQETDRGGDITYHGPGQLVVYPIVDLNAFSLGLHDHMRMLEQCVIDACASWGVHAERDPGATGVWVRMHMPDAPAQAPSAKLCACGVRVRRWISMHGLAINVDTNLRHFDLIVPCGLVGRKVTSLRELLGDRTPSMDEVRERIVSKLTQALHARPITPRAM
jgi:lipoyl(octanoyl) transferase